MGPERHCEWKGCGAPALYWTTDGGAGIAYCVAHLETALRLRLYDRLSCSSIEVSLAAGFTLPARPLPTDGQFVPNVQK